MDWRKFAISPTATHHLHKGVAVYAERFDEVLAFQEPGMAAVRLGCSAWHITANGQAAYFKKFLRTFGFYEGLAAVSRGSCWHHINPDGSDAYTQRYAWCGNFQCGRAPVRDFDGHYFHVTLEGKPVYRQHWHYAGDFLDGVAVVQAENGRSTHIDAAGNFLHKFWFLDLDVFHKGFARARDESGWLHVNRAGEPAYANRFASVEPFYNGQARVERFDGALEIIDESGCVVVEIRPALRSEFSALSGDLVGFWRSQTIAAAVELGVFEAMPGSVVGIAQACGLRPDRMFRLLRALDELCLVRMYDQKFQLTARGEYLRVEHPQTLSGAAREYGRHFSEMWQCLPDAIREGEKWIAPEIFCQVAEEPARCKAHHEMLRSYAMHDYIGVPKAIVLNGNERVVDAGGGLGVLSGLLADHYPNISVLLLDRPEVIEQLMSRGPLSDRIDTLVCDLLEPWRVEADAVVLARVLHDWSDSDALRILANARAALRPGGLLFVVEMLIPSIGASGGLCDLHLLMATGGQERTADEYKELMELSGFYFAEVRQLVELPAVIRGVAC